MLINYFGYNKKIYIASQATLGWYKNILISLVKITRFLSMFSHIIQMLPKTLRILFFFDIARDATYIVFLRGIITQKLIELKGLGIRPYWKKTLRAKI